MEDDCPVKSIHAKLDKEVCAFEKVLLRENCEDTMSSNRGAGQTEDGRGLKASLLFPQSAVKLFLLIPSERDCGRGSGMKVGLQL